MKGYKYIYKGYALPHTPAEAKEKHFYAIVKWAEISTHSSVQFRQDYHGGFSSPALAEPRLITVLGDVFGATREERGIGANNLETIFTLEDNPEFGEGFYPLEFTDDDGSEWYFNCMVRKPVSFPETQRGTTTYPFRVELLAQDPFRYSKEVHEVIGYYGSVGGYYLRQTLPYPLREPLNYTEVINTGNFGALPRFIITGQIKNPRVYNSTIGRYFGIDLDINMGDELIINLSDPANGGRASAMLNGQNVMGYLRKGSLSPRVVPGLNKFVLLGDDFEIYNTKKAQMKIIYNDIKL